MNKLQKFKFTTGKKILTIVLWTLILFLVFNGVKNILKPISISNIEKDIYSSNKEELGKKTLEVKGCAYAESFIREYMSFDTTEEEYKKRMIKYTDLEISNDNPFYVDYVNSINYTWNGNNLIVDCIVNGRKIVKINLATPNDSTVKAATPSQTATPKPTATKKPATPKPTVRKTPTPTPTEPPTPTPTPVKEEREVYYIRVSIYIQDGKFSINKYPIFISNPNRKNRVEEEIKGVEVQDEGEKKQIEKLLKSFLTAYYNGENTEISYFLENDDFMTNEEVKEFKFSEIDNIDLNWDEKSNYFVNLIYTVTQDNGFEIKQQMQFEIIKNDDKFKILKYDSSVF